MMFGKKCKKINKASSLADSVKFNSTTSANYFGLQHRMFCLNSVAGCALLSIVIDEMPSGFLVSRFDRPRFVDTPPAAPTFLMIANTAVFRE